MRKIKVLIVEYSLLLGKILSDLLTRDSRIEVVGVVRDCDEALLRIENLHPDVVMMDLDASRVDVLAFVKWIVRNTSASVIMLSDLTKDAIGRTFEALELGAVDYIPKPSSDILDGISYFQATANEIISKIKMAASANILKTIKPIKCLEAEPIILGNKIVAIGASTGGPQALTYILTRLPQNIPPILIVQHMPEGFTGPFAERLDRMCKFEVKEAEEGDYISKDLVLIAPGGFHMTVSKTGRIHLEDGPLIHYVKPAVDPMMETVAEHYKSRVIGVLLTGSGRDGALGMRRIKEKGGVTIAQDEKTSVVFGMPKAAIEEGCVDIVLPLYEIPQEIIWRCRE
ncbi:chemotaxis response regulator protein-glutamate methylesterase [Candidatus Bathyarchaeota archaeon]|nr:chemotaxis response regulator protein-glutamate methylesterase [Candidatus Bathyarchaeota archaeon]